MSVKYHTNKEKFGYNFISTSYIPKGKDEYYIRNEQVKNKNWKKLTPEQISKLEKNGNTSANWSDVLITNTFNIDSIKNSSFYGLVRIGDIGCGYLQHHDFSISEGITESCIISCDIGNHVAIHNCTHISHYIISDYVILSMVGELAATNHCKSGNGILKEGEPEDVRIWIDTLNEAGGRSILPFYDMICADAYLWTVFRDEKNFIKALFTLTQNSYDTRRGSYALIEEQTVIKSCLTIKDTSIGSFAYIKGANKIKNVSIKSNEDEVTQIGEGVELVNGIIGYGCHIFYGSKAVRFIIGNNCSLKYGARLIHSVLGDNSTVSCCEVLNNLVFPCHEQHHNNSFLIASMIMGQSNMAAGATVGSNHNSRGNDGEIIAGRGFWPGLSSTLKHNSRFASFTLISKGNYPNEMNIMLPFSLVSRNPNHGRLEVMPAYYWMYNLYALERNAWKYKNRDKRKHIEQFIVTDYLAPDTTQEIIQALTLLEHWSGKAIYKFLGETLPTNTDDFIQRGKQYLLTKPEVINSIQVVGENMERTHEEVHIIKVSQAYTAYRNMLLFYAITSIAEYLDSCNTNILSFLKTKTNDAFLQWDNIGGQLIPTSKLNHLRQTITKGKFITWKQVHGEYKKLWAQYTLDNALTGLHVLKVLYATSSIGKDMWNSLISEAIEIRKYIEKQVFVTKNKDYTNTFRSCTYRNKSEQDAVLGTVNDNQFIKTAKKDTKEFIKLISKLRL